MTTEAEYGRLLDLTKAIVENSASPEAQGFDSEAWLSRWLGHPQPCLLGRTPAEQLKEPGGLNVVARILGSIESGAYQ